MPNNSTKIQAESVPLETWQRWAAYRYILGDVWLSKLYGVGPRTLQRYSADPAFTESSERNPDDRHRTVLRQLMERGRPDLARQVVGDDAQLVGCELRCLDEVEPDKRDIRDECLDDHGPVHEFHEAVRSRQSVKWVRHLWQQAKKELDETMALYEQQAPESP